MSLKDKYRTMLNVGRIMLPPEDEGDKSGAEVRKENDESDSDSDYDFAIREKKRKM